jgi:UDP-arabinose 4-epimerase
MRQTVLVTGGAGYIGSHTCKALAAAGFLPVSYDNLVYGHRWAVKWGPLVEGDLANQELLEWTLREYRMEGVVYFAGYAYVGESIRKPSKYFTNNVVNTLNLLEVMRRTGVRHIVFSSTCATYGIPAQVPISEDCPQQPVNPYGESKLFIERAMRWYSQAYGTSWVALRYFNAAGADPEGEIGEDHDPETHLIPLVIQAAMGHSHEVEIYGTDYETPDGTAMRDYVHVTDLADAHVQALGYLLDGNGPIALNLGTGLGHSVREIIRAVERVEGVRVPTREGPRRLGDPPALVADPSQARYILGWQPVLSDLDTLVATAWKWHARRLCLNL